MMWRVKKLKGKIRFCPEEDWSLQELAALIAMIGQGNSTAEWKASQIVRAGMTRHFEFISDGDPRN